MAIFNNIIKSDGNSLVRKPTSTFAGVVQFPLTYAVLPYAQLNNLVGWFNNGDGVTTATGVSAWVDRVSGASLAQATGALQPTYTQQVNTLNGKNKIAFATTQLLSAGDVFDIRTNTGYTAQIYCQLKISNTNRLLLGKSQNSTAPTVAGEYQIVSPSALTLGARFFDTSLKATAPFTFDANNFYLYTIVVDITNSLLSFYVNEKAVATVAISNSLVDYNNGLAFGVGSASTLTVDALEVLVYQTALTQAEITQNTNALKGKFGQI